MARYRREAPAERQAEDAPKGIADAFALEQLDWLRAIREGRQPRMTGEEGTVDLALSYAILESGLLGRAVTLEEMLKGEVEVYQNEIKEYYQLKDLSPRPPSLKGRGSRPSSPLPRGD
jgi:hypothetical protein